MKHLIQITTAILLLVTTISYSQTKTIEDNSKNKTTKTQVDTKNLKKFVGKYLLEEANFTLEITQENDKMYIITEFSKDALVLKNETTLNEPTRNVNFELINDDKKGIKYTQNGYETILKRIE